MPASPAATFSTFSALGTPASYEKETPPQTRGGAR